MIDSSVARRYARALFTLEAETPARTHDARLESLTHFAEALESSEELRVTLLGPGFSADQRHALLLKQIGAAASVQGFLHVLVERSRLGALPAIVEAYRELADGQAGRVRAQVKAAYELSPAELTELTAALSVATHKQVVLSTTVDPSLIGGVVAEVGGTRYDGSLQTQLARLRRDLLDKSL